MLAANDEDRAFLRDPDNSGGSTIIGPHSTVIAGPMSNEEGILYADIDLEACVRENVITSYSIHYTKLYDFRSVFQCLHVFVELLTAMRWRATANRYVITSYSIHYTKLYEVKHRRDTPVAVAAILAGQGDDPLGKRNNFV